ncbi:MAG: RimK family alpha-L-glutamate ligase [Bacilli bacterium]|nr:RimK family alpha-L-glutamate ligase [Bacilli bacterium]
MFNKGLIVTNAFKIWPAFHHYVMRMEEEFKRYNVGIDVKSCGDILVHIDSDGNIKTKELPYDFILFLDKDYYIAKMLEKAGFRLFNKADAIKVCDDKMLTHIALANSGIQMPKTIAFPLKYAPADINPFIDNVIKELGFPLICKEIYGSLGEQVYLCHNKDELMHAESLIQDRPHIYQEYIESSYGKDMRVVVIGGKVVAWMQRVAQDEGEFRSNIETGGIGLQPELEEIFAKTAVKVEQLLGLDYCGLDLLYGPNNEPILCEVNANAYLEPIEKYSLKNVGGAYADHIYQEVYKKKFDK